jgi:leucyl/phenylalanyl-tRNA--protein transferase
MHFLGADRSWFPPVEDTDEDGILAVGGDLSTERLLHAYRRGIFPWYSEGLPILWHCPNPRFVLVPGGLHVPRSLRKALKHPRYSVKLDTSFGDVIDACARTRRPGQRGTWITRDMRAAYVRLHGQGLAHSAEAWLGDQLVGGLYGVCLGAVFFGESMFARADDASKVAFVLLVDWLRSWGVQLIDCQQETEHLARFGAEAWPRERFVAEVSRLVALDVRPPAWRLPGEAVGG